MKTFRLLVLVAALSTVLVLASSAGAATTIGSKCVSNNGAPSTLFTTGTANGESYVVPSNGVLTAWGTDRTQDPNPAAVAAVLGSPTGPNWVVLSSTAYETVPGSSAASFLARLPVSAGQTLGSATFFSGSPVMCSTSNVSDVGVYFGNPVAIGVPFAPVSITTYKAAIWATIEPDGDGDGYGDESQDKCPQSAAWQNPCPVLKIGQLLSATSTEIKILASTTVDTTLTATATVTIASKTKATFKSKATAFTASKFKTIKLKLPTSVKNALKKKSLKATVTLTGNGIANTATATSKVTLKKK